MIHRKEIKARARQQLGGGIFKEPWLMAVLMLFVFSVIESAVSSITGIPAVIGAVGALATGRRAATALLSGASMLTSALSLAAALARGPFGYGMAKAFLRQGRGEKKLELKDLFTGFTEQLGDNVLIALLTGVFTLLWSLLFVIPGIIKAYSYSFVYFIKADRPDMEARECLRESQRLTEGYKWKLFVLDLSYIGWHIVGALCLGLGGYWVDAWLNAAKAQFYMERVAMESVPAADDTAAGAQA